MITDAQLSEWQALCEAATPPPWKVVRHIGQNTDMIISGENMKVADAKRVTDWHGIPDAKDRAFVAASRSALPLLIEEVKRLNEVASSHADALDEAIAEMRRHADTFQIENRERESMSLRNVIQIAVRSLRTTP